MSMRMILWTVIGISAGVTHAASLWRCSHAVTQGWTAVWRLPVVAGVLVSAALVHALLPAVVGWFAGLTLASMVYLLRARRWM
jgi:hypothetical protein